MCYSQMVASTGNTIVFMSCPLARITMIFFVNFLCWKENRGFVANKILSNIFKYNILNILTKAVLKQQGETRMKREANP